MEALERALEHPPVNTAVGAKSHLDGLARRSVSPLDIWAQSVAAVGPSSGALIATVMAAQIAGRGVWLSVVLAVAGSLALARVFGHFGSRIAGSGSLYTYVAHSFGPRVSLAVAAALVLGYGSLAVLGLVDSSHHLLAGAEVVVGGPTPMAWQAGLSLVIGLLCGAVLYRGVRVSTRITLLFEAVGLTLLTVLVIVAVVRDGLPGIDAFDLSRSSPVDILVAAAIMAGALMGFESSASLGAEASRPFAAVPKAMSRTVLLAGVLYLVVVILGVDSRPVIGGRGAGIWFVLFDSSTTLLAVSHLVLALCFLPVALAGWTSVSRLLFVLGREGALPLRLGRTHARHQTPHIAILCTTVPAIGVALGLTVFGTRGEGPSGLRPSGLLMDTGLLAIYLAYAITCAALPFFLNRIGELTWQYLLGAIVGVVASGLIFVVLVVKYVDADELLSALAIPLVAMLGFAWSALVGKRAELGKHDQAIASDTLG